MWCFFSPKAELFLLPLAKENVILLLKHFFFFFFFNIFSYFSLPCFFLHWIPPDYFFFATSEH